MKTLAHALCLALAASVLAGSACSRSAPQPKLELHLDLAKKTLRRGEYLWYRLEIKNTGRCVVPIYDAFWLDQRLQGKNWDHKTGTFFRIAGKDGRELPLGVETDFEGIFYFWRNDESKYVSPRKQGFSGFLYSLLDRRVIPPELFWMMFDGIANPFRRDLQDPILLLKPGQSFVATPSQVAPVDEQSAWRRDRVRDPRLILYRPPGWSPQAVEKLKRDWKADIEQNELYGAPPFHPDRMDVPALNGYRVLERVAWSPPPGKYTIRVVFDGRPTDESPSTKKLSRGEEFAPQAPVASNSVEFEVVR